MKSFRTARDVYTILYFSFDNVVGIGVIISCKRVPHHLNILYLFLINDNRLLKLLAVGVLFNVHYYVTGTMVCMFVVRTL